MNSLSLSTPIKDLFMVGPTYAKRLQKLGIETAEDLVHYYPFRYDDFSLISPINKIQLGEVVTIRGVILDFKNIFTKTGKKIQEAQIADNFGQITVIWFNQPFLANTIKSGVRVALSGKVDFFGHKIALISPDYEILKQSLTIHTGRLVPIYPETYGVSSKWLRSRIWPLLNSLLPQIEDWQPPEIKKENNLDNLQSALRKIHFPDNLEEINQAKERLGFDELFLVQLASSLRRKEWQELKSAYAFKIENVKINKFINKLAFKLTNSQNKVAGQILTDLKKTKPMNRLLEGDVGSGKTVVACIAMYAAYLNGLTSVLMAPTEILAQQHYQTVKTLLEPFGLKISLLTSSNKLPASHFPFPAPNILIGTHALIYDKVKIKKLGLIVIDEQHRFGVEQRAKLIDRGIVPHILTMTATPIPRTIALTLFGDLDLSIIDEMPKGRKQIKTWVVPLYKRLDAYEWIKKLISALKAQVFIVCPLIDQSDKDTMKEIKAAKAEYEKLSKNIFPQFKVGLLHGKMPAKEKDTIINDFRNNKLDILVATPVVEVGIDIPNATIMIIEGADRFGLAQLHQLRGRVGRSDRQSYCLLFASEENKFMLKRLKAMSEYQSGFQLAEIDLKLRGPGDIYGTNQHGFIKNFKIATFSNHQLVAKTHLASQKTIEKLNRFPLLQKKLKTYKMKFIEPN